MDAGRSIEKPPRGAVRIILITLTGFNALTAVGGGLALIGGFEAQRFPAAWLEGSPFPDYTLPGLILALGVGGSSLAAFLAALLKRRSAPALAVFAGLCMAGFITGEVLILRQQPPGPTPVEILYFVLGLIVCLLGVRAWAARRRSA